jgi:1,4-dihydroxy-2-naphthoate octaprenyltransferase
MLVKKDEIKVKSMKKKVFITVLLCTLIVGAGVGLIIDIPAVA